MNRMNLRLLGRFRGYEYFQGALVEPGFVVGSRRSEEHQPQKVTVLVADEKAEDAALRSLRKGRRQMSEPEEGVHLSFDYSEEAITPAAWMPRTFEHETLLAALATTPRVQSIFNVMQGAHTGANDIFILTEEELQQLPEQEREYFKPAAGTKTIRDGQLLEGEYVFFPYDEQGLVLRTRDELQAAVPQFYSAALAPNEPRLAQRASLVERNAAEWWVLNRERQWHRRRQRKILSGYFGGRGAFAYDSTGKFVCVHGYTWFPVNQNIQLPDENDSIEFYDTNFPWAYIALLNSRPFELLLSCFCSRVQGGQYNLSKRFVNNVPLPDLFQDVPGDLVAELAKIGRSMGSGLTINENWLSPLVSRAYGVPLSEWNFDEQR